MFPTPTPDANVVRYRVLFRAPQTPPAAADGATLAPVNALDDRAFAESRAALYAAFVARQVGDFIWHKHAMHLRVAPVASAPLLRAFCLEGETSVGDAIDDEWVVTWLLFRLTAEFPEDDAVVQVHDTDGEFLLIECADVLPAWVSPENSADRVFVRNGELHLVDVEAVPEVAESLAAELRANKTKRHRKPAETDPRRVFRGSVSAVYDERVATRAHVAMQRTIQQKLAEAPRYMRANRHRVRCLLPAKAARVLSACPQVTGAVVEAFYYREPREAAAVCSQMKTFPPQDMTTKSVTMSRCQYAQLKQQYFFPPKPFHHLPGVEGMKANDDNRSGSAETRAAEIGVKLTCGLELLYATDECDQFGTPWRQIIGDALASVETSGITAFSDNEVDDDDAWLYMHPDSLEEKLQNVAMRQTQAGADGQEEDIVGGAEELQNIATMFNNFMGGVSGIDGVESTEPVQLDMSAFMKLLNGQMGNGSPGDEDDDDEWDDPEDVDDDDDDDESSVDSDDELDEEPEDEEDRIMREAMEEMDAELAGSTLSKTFTRVDTKDVGIADSSNTTESSSNTTLADEDKPLDLDFNLLSNLLESMASQEGLAGPVSNILSELSASSSR